MAVVARLEEIDVKKLTLAFKMSNKIINGIFSN
jgi:hypothetical protein